MNQFASDWLIDERDLQWWVAWVTDWVDHGDICYPEKERKTWHREKAMAVEEALTYCFHATP